MKISKIKPIFFIPCIVVGIIVCGIYAIYGTQRGFWADQHAKTPVDAVADLHEFGDKETVENNLIGMVGPEHAKLVIIQQDETHIACIPVFQTTRFFRTYYYSTSYWFNIVP